MMKDNSVIKWKVSEFRFNVAMAGGHLIFFLPSVIVIMVLMFSTGSMYGFFSTLSLQERQKIIYMVLMPVFALLILIALLYFLESVYLSYLEYEINPKGVQIVYRHKIRFFEKLNRLRYSLETGLFLWKDIESIQTNKKLGLIELKRRIQGVVLNPVWIVCPLRDYNSIKNFLNTT